MFSQTSRFCGGGRLRAAWLMICLAVGLLLASQGCKHDLVPATPDSQLPKPDPANPVNYIKWLNETMGGGLEENAADVYREACSSLTPFDGDWGDVLVGPWSDNKQVSDWLIANAEAIAKFRKAAAMQECFLPVPDRESTGDPRRDHLVALCMIPSLSDYRQLVKALIAEGYRAWQQGDHEVLPANALLALKSAQHLDNTPIVIQRLVSTAITKMAYAALIKAMGLSEKPDAMAKHILDELRAVDRSRPPFSQACLTERLAGWDYAQRVFVPGTQPGPWTVHGPLVDTTITPEQKLLIGEDEWRKFSEDMKNLGKIGFDATLREMDAFYDELDRWLAKPYPVAAGEADRFETMTNQSANPLVRMFVCSSLPRARAIDEHATAVQRATHLVAYILIHHGNTGSYPASLGELKTAYLKELRTDPFSGHDFVYKKQDGDFVLYSVAQNIKDDGGRHDKSWKEGDFVFWPPQDQAK